MSNRNAILGSLIRQLSSQFLTKIPTQVNSTVPIVSEVYKSKNVYNPKRLFGVTTLDVVRASRFISQVQNTDPTGEKVPVVGGHSGVTIVPRLSQSAHPSIAGEARDALVNRIQFGGDEVVKAKDGAGSATLSMAFAGAEFATKVLKAIRGEKGIIAPTYVHLSADEAGGAALKKELGTELEYFSANVEIGPEGVAKINPLGKLTEFEQGLIKAAIPELQKNIETVSTWLFVLCILAVAYRAAAGRHFHPGSQALMWMVERLSLVYHSGLTGNAAAVR